MAERAARRATRAVAPRRARRGVRAAHAAARERRRGRGRRDARAAPHAAADRFRWPWERRRSGIRSRRALRARVERLLLQPRARAVLVERRRPLLRARPAQVRAQPAPGPDARLHHRTSPTTTPTSRRRSRAMGHGATDARRGIRSAADPARALHRRADAEPLGGAPPGPCGGARAEQPVARVPGQPHRARGAHARDQLGRADEPDGADAERRPRLLHPHGLEGVRRRVGVLAASGVPSGGSRCIRPG